MGYAWVTAGIAVFTLAMIVCVAVYKSKTHTYQDETCTAVVTKKEHCPEFFYYWADMLCETHGMSDGYWLPEQFLVHFKTDLEGIKVVTDDDVLYHQVREGSRLKVNLEVRRDRHGRPKGSRAIGRCVHLPD